jgi:hypothetical protein
MSILAGLGLNVLSQSLRTDRVPAAAWPYLLVILQFILVAYDPRSHTPQRGSAAAGHRFVEVLRNSEGDVWVPYHNYLASMAGKRAHAHWMAVADILRYSEPAIAGPLRSDLTAAIEGRRFGLIVTSNRPFPSFPSLEPSYSLKGEVFDNSNLFWPLTGARRRPERIYVPLESFAKE